MTIKELFKNIQATNRLQKELQSRERAGVEIYINGSQVGHECHSLTEFVDYMENEYVIQVVNACLENNFTKTYNNTLSATIYVNNVKIKVDLFVDMGGF